MCCKAGTIMTNTAGTHSGDTSRSGCGRASAAAISVERHSCCDHDTDHASHTVRDVVCGMTVDPATSKHRFDYRGETFHFCSAGCRTKFSADPEKYLDTTKARDAAKSAEADVAAGTIYTCPMHPE